MRIIFLFFIFFSLSINAQVFPVPEDKEVNFDVLRKNKVIGNLTTKFLEENENLILHSILDIEVKVLFFPAYKFFQETRETWSNGNFIAIDGFTDFEDDREYKIEGKDTNGMFIATGMDGLIEMDEIVKKINNLSGGILLIDYGYLNLSNKSLLNTNLNSWQNVFPLYPISPIN